MAETDDIWYGGTVRPSAEGPGPTAQRAWRYGDGLFETLRVCKGTPLFFTRHYSRLILGMDTLGLAVPEHWQPGWLRLAVVDLLEARGLANARVRLQVWRAGGGLYTPQSDAPDLLIEAEALSGPFYGFPREGLHLGVAESVTLARRPIDAVKGAVALPYVLAAREREALRANGGPDELLLRNDAGRPVEAVSANLFAFGPEGLCTPPLSEGGIPGVMRRVILRAARAEGIPVSERPLTDADLLAADELFLTNVIQGMRWVARFGDREYANSFAAGLFGKLEEKVLAELARPWPPR
jgi:branched-chain amino acid aminotransferase